MYYERSKQQKIRFFVHSPLLPLSALNVFYSTRLSENPFYFCTFCEYRNRLLVDAIGRTNKRSLQTTKFNIRLNIKHLAGYTKTPHALPNNTWNSHQAQVISRANATRVFNMLATLRRDPPYLMCAQDNNNKLYIPRNCHLFCHCSNNPSNNVTLDNIGFVYPLITSCGQKYLKN